MMRLMLTLLVVSTALMTAPAARAYESFDKACQDGRTKYDAGEYDAAKRAYSEALKLAGAPGEKSYAQLHIADSCYAGRLKDEALIEYAKVLDIEGAHPHHVSSALLQTGIIQNERGLYEKARVTLEKVVAMPKTVPDDYKASALFHVGEAYFNEGNYNLSRDAYSKAMKFDTLLPAWQKKLIETHLGEINPMAALPADREASYARIEANAGARVEAIAKLHNGLRMVIGCPAGEWGIDAQIREELTKAHVKVLAYPDAPDMLDDGDVVKSDDARRYNIIIFGDALLSTIEPDPHTGEMPEKVRDQVPILRRFLQEGGGIWFSSLGSGNWGRSSHVLNYILKELNLEAEVVGEVIKDSAPPTGTFKFGPYTWSYAWAEIMPSPLTEGLKGLWHPSGSVASEGTMGVVPIVNLSPEWQVLVKGSPTAASYGLDLKKSTLGTELLTTPGIVKSSPVLCAVRQAGKGRVVLWPTWPNFTVTGGSGGMLLDGESDGRTSDGARLIENLLCWLAEPSQGSKAIGQFDPAAEKVPPPQYDVDKELGAWAGRAGRKDYANQYKGLIGAHSNLSDGESSPEGMIAAAKAAGYDFIAFTEDLSKMSEAKWKALVAVCDESNGADGSILVNAPRTHWESQKKWNEPLSVEFSGVSIAQLPATTNVLGLGSDRHAPEMAMWVFDGSVKPNKLVPLRAAGGKEFWSEGYEHAVDLEKLPDITARENAVNLRIDWQPGKSVAYFLNGRKIVEFTTSVPSAAAPVYVWDNTAGFRMKSIAVTSLAKKGEALLMDDFTKAKQFDAVKTWRLTGTGAPIIEAAPSFLAYPGLDLLDEAGDRLVVFGQRYWVRDDWWSKEKPGRIQYLNNFTYQADAVPWGWFPRVIIRSKTNNKRPWNQALWSFLGAYCYEGGKLVDDSSDEWRQLIGPNVFFLTAGIMAVHTTRSAGEVVKSAAEGLYQTYVRAENLSQVLSRIKGHIGVGGYFSSYVSAGPEILDFRVKAVYPDGEGMSLDIPGNDRGMLHLLVHAEAGLKEVAVYDGTRLVRRFLPEGKTFERFLTFHPDSYHAYSLTVADRAGREAVSWPAWMQIQENVHRRCGDNWNWMTTGKYRRGAPSVTPPKRKFNLLEIHQGWQSQTWEEKKAQSRLAYNSEQGYYGHGGFSAAINPYISPELLVDGKPWEAWLPVVTMDFETIGRHGAIVTNTIRQDYLVRDPDPATTGCFGGPYQAVPSPWPADFKQYATNCKIDGARVNRLQGKVVFSREVSTPDGKPIRLSLGDTGQPGADILEVMQADGTSKRHDMRDGVASGEIPPNGYICWYDGKGDGIGGVIALSQGVKYSYNRRSQRCFIEVPSPAAPGTEAAWDLIFVAGTPTTSNSNILMEDVRAGMGVSGAPTLYAVTPRSGKVVNQKFFLTLQAEDGGFSGKIARTTERPLPIHLPVMLKEVNPRWDAAIWYRGRNLLETIRYYRDGWGGYTWDAVGSWEPRVDEIQYIPVIEGGTAYCQVETDKQDADVFMGNLLVCDEPEAFITVTRAAKGQCTFEVNNPTDRERTITVRPAKGFELTGQWSKQLTLKAGGWQVVSAGNN